MNAPRVADALAPVANLLERLGVRYHVGGSVASSSYGAPRATMDVDLVADLRPEHAAPLARELQTEYYVDEDVVRDAIARSRSFNVIHLQTMIKVDVFVPPDRPFDRQEMARARVRTLDLAPGARSFPVKSAEDRVLRKLEWYRAGGEVSERQWGDVLGVLKVQAAALDRAYLDRWAAQLSLADLLERAWGEASA